MGYVLVIYRSIFVLQLSVDSFYVTDFNPRYSFHLQKADRFNIPKDRITQLMEEMV